MVNSGDCRAESSQMCSVSSRDFTGIILMLVENEQKIYPYNEPAHEKS
jgi:hypothetical protein